MEDIANTKDPTDGLSGVDQTTKYIMAIIAAIIFMGAAFYLPAETFMAFFAVVLFIIPVSFFIHMIQKM